jgi:hypothetical protein
MTVETTSNLAVKAVDSGVANAARHGAYYNGFYFPPTAFYKAYSRPVYSNNGRTVIRRNPVISIEFEFFPEDYVYSGGGGTNWGPNEPRVLSNIQQALETPGKPFCIMEGGLGNYCINSTKSTDRSVFPEAFTDKDDEDSGRMVYAKDLDGGPKPKLTVYDPHPGGNRVKVVWEVELAINRCGTWQPGSTDLTGWEIPSGTVIDSVCEVTYNVADGLSTRTIALDIQIVNLYDDTDSRSLEKSLDDYTKRYADAILVLPAHKREIERRLGSDGRTFSLRIVDKQIDAYSPYPIGVRDISLLLTYESGIENGGFGVWGLTLDYSASVYPGVPKSYAADPLIKFLAYQRNREAAITRLGGFPGQRRPLRPDLAFPNQNPSLEGLNQLWAVRFGPNNIYDTVFRAQFQFQQSFHISKIFLISGVLDTYNASNWDAWNRSTQYHHETTGILGIQQTKDHTDVQNICGGGVTNLDTTLSPKTIAQLLGQIASTCPPADKSWLDFKNFFDYMEKEPVVQLKKAVGLTAPQDSLAPGGNNQRLLGQQNQQGGVQVNPNQLNQAQREIILRPVFQANAQGEYSVRMIGYAFRMGHKIEVPKLLKFQGANCIISKTIKLSTGPVSQVISGCTLYRAEWHIVYKLDRRANGDDSQTQFAAPIPTIPGPYY